MDNEEGKTEDELMQEANKERDEWGYTPEDYEAIEHKADIIDDNGNTVSEIRNREDVMLDALENEEKTEDELLQEANKMREE